MNIIIENIIEIWNRYYIPVGITIITEMMYLAFNSKINQTRTLIIFHAIMIVWTALCAFIITQTIQCACYNHGATNIMAKLLFACAIPVHGVIMTRLLIKKTTKPLNKQL